MLKLMLNRCGEGERSTWRETEKTDFLLNSSALSTPISNSFGEGASRPGQSFPRSVLFHVMRPLTRVAAVFPRLDSVQWDGRLLMSSWP